MNGPGGRLLDRTVCGKSMANQQASRFGVCGRPSSGGIAVTFAQPSNKLGLKTGDVVVKVGEDSGDDIFEASYLRPVCGGIFPAKSGRRYAGAASFFGNVPAGMKLSVRGPSGATREVTVPTEADAKETDCTDPFSRSRAVYAEAKTRPDGVAVIRLPSFVPFDKEVPTDTSEFDAFAAAYQAELVKVFDTVKTAPAIIWDTRGNTGGLTKVGLAIVSGFASARATQLSYCRTRSPGSSPPSFEHDRYALYDVAPAPTGPFAYAGKVAVVADGLGYSAGDYFPFAVAKASGVPVIGSASAGAFGGGNGPIELDGPPKLSANYDPTACFDAATNTPSRAIPSRRPSPSNTTPMISRRARIRSSNARPRSSASSFTSCRRPTAPPASRRASPPCAIRNGSPSARGRGRAWPRSSALRSPQRSCS